MSETIQKMPDGIIELDTSRGNLLNFTSDRFGSGSYLWKQGQSVTVSFIESRRKGNFRALIEQIRDAGLTVEIPTPLPQMERIVRKNGYRRVIREDPTIGQVEVWVSP